MKYNPNILTAIAAVVLSVVFLSVVYGAGLLAGHSQGKADELAKWRQLVLPLGMSIIKRYDPITGEAKLVLTKDDGQTTIMEVKP
jgi:hypothetical protein